MIVLCNSPSITHAKTCKDVVDQAQQDCVSQQMPPNTESLIGFGQDDECIFKQCMFASKAWTAPDGKKPIIPKDAGLGVMLSAFVS
jgi:hypothetical protein